MVREEANTVTLLVMYRSVIVEFIAPIILLKYLIEHKYDPPQLLTLFLPLSLSLTDILLKTNSYKCSHYSTSQNFPLGSQLSF